MSDRKPTTPWRPPTRRAFVAMIAAAAAAVAVRERARVRVADPDEDRPRSTWNGRTRWIGHC